MDSKVHLDAEFSATAQLRFQVNMMAFKRYFPEIYQKFAHYQPSDKYKLLLNENGTANMLAHETGLPMYSEDPVAQIEVQVEATLAKPVFNSFDFSAFLKEENSAEFIHVDLANAIGNIYEQAKAKLPANNKLDAHIPSKLIFGIGLGYHLWPLRAASKATYLTIFEPNTDYFFASLHCFDWQRYLDAVDADGSSVFISIGDSEAQIYESLVTKKGETGQFTITSGFFYQHYPSPVLTQLMNSIRQNFGQLSTSNGFFDDGLLSIAHTIDVLKQSPKVMKSQLSMAKSITQYPIFIVANGPSLENDIENIKRHQGNAIIVACESAATALLAHGITPDFYAALERTKLTADFVKAFISEEQVKKMNLLTLNVMYPGTVQLFDWAGIAIKGGEPGTSIYQLSELVQGKQPMTLGYCNPFSGNLGFSFFCHLGFENIYLLGYDFGYLNHKQHHAESSFYFNDLGDSVCEPLKMGGDIKVQGNFGHQVLSEPYLLLGKEQAERLIEYFKDTALTCYNCSDGVKIAGTEPLNSNEIMLDAGKDKQAVIEALKQTGFEAVNQNVDLSVFLDFETFDTLCADMSGVLKGQVHCREEGLKRLNEHLSYLNAHKDGIRYQHLYLLLRGETLYITTILIGLLYNYGDEQSIMAYFNEALGHYHDFLVKAPQYYRQRWDQNSNYTADFV